MFGRFFRRRNRGTNRRIIARRTLIEGLESRTLLSVTGPQTVQPDLSVLSYATSSASIQGYTPAQIRKAYGFDKVTFANSTVAANGAGQTIAIIDAYNDPNIVSDLKVFDSQFGLADPPSLKVVNQTGGSKLPTADSGWAGEIALDVEWAHAIAPLANILLVEASTADVTNLMKGVDYARSAAGVSVVTMSWGGSEFFSWGGGESQSQLTYDPSFTTPAGHVGVTFVASAGDSGTSSGVQWPASSPNVISVGGTSLYLDSNGNYLSESSWNGTSGGYSQVETVPSYQTSATSSATRAVPDVSYAGDPNTGFAVYDSLPDQGYSGWQEVGGTSAGAPQWAALIAIADQGRVIAGNSTLDGKSQTLPILYSLYSAPGTTGYSSYTSNFNDVIDTTGGGGGYRFRWGGYGYRGIQATSGYDAVTGLGSPKAQSIVDALVGSSSTSGSGGSSSSGGSSGSTGGSSTPATLAASPLSAVFTSSLPVNAVGGSTGILKLRLTDIDASKFTGPITITLYASTDGTVSSDDAVVQTFTYSRISLRTGASRTLKLKFSYPTGVADGSYNLIASVSATATNTAAATATTATAVNIAAPKVDLAASAPAGESVLVTAGKHGSVTIILTNLGNVTATGNLSVSLYASSDSALDSSDRLLTTLSAIRINLRPGRSKTLHLHFVAPLGQAGGTYTLLGAITSSTTPTDTNSSNDTVAISTRSA